jgi:pimeloyl-ACP methyl ester carboxylesterase
MPISSRTGVIGVLLGGLALGGCQMAETSLDEPLAGAAVQMVHDTARHGGPVARANRQMQRVEPHIYLIRGLANVFSRGMDDLAGKLAARGYRATVHEYGSWEAIAEDIVAQQQATGGRFQAVLIGHSLGANAITDIANYVAQHGGSIALAVAFDPTERNQVIGGVRRLVNFYQSNNGFGSAVDPGPGFRGRIDNVDLQRSRNLGHFNIEKDAGLHARVIALVGQAVGGARGRSAPAGRHAAR